MVTLKSLREWREMVKVCVRALFRVRFQNTDRTDEGVKKAVEYEIKVAPTRYKWIVRKMFSHADKERK